MTYHTAKGPILAFLAFHGSFVSTSPMPPTQNIHWFACPQNASIATTCGTLDVPLDYTATASNESLTLQLVKVRPCLKRRIGPCRKLGSLIHNGIDQCNDTAEQRQHHLRFWRPRKHQCGQLLWEQWPGAATVSRSTSASQDVPGTHALSSTDIKFQDDGRRI